MNKEMQSSPKTTDAVEECRYHGEDKLLLFPMKSLHDVHSQGNDVKSVPVKSGSSRTLSSLPLWKSQSSRQTTDGDQQIRLLNESLDAYCGVRFAKAPPVIRYISPIETDLEREMRWYSKAELRTIRKETKAALDTIKTTEKGTGKRRARRRSITGSSTVSSSASPPLQSQRKAWWNPGGLSMFKRKRSSSANLETTDNGHTGEDDEFTTRGLEHLLDPFMLSYRDVVWGNIVKAVLKEQMRQRAFGEDDGPEAIARVACQCSKLSKYNARKMGLVDEMEVRQSAFLVKRKSPRRNSIGDIDMDVGLSSRSESDLPAVSCDIGLSDRMNSSDSSILESQSDLLLHVIDDNDTLKTHEIELEVTNVRPLSMRRASFSGRRQTSVETSCRKLGWSSDNHDTSLTSSSHHLTNSGQNDDLLLGHINESRTLSRTSSRSGLDDEITNVRPLSTGRRRSYPTRLRPDPMVSSSQMGMEHHATRTQETDGNYMSPESS